MKAVQLNTYGSPLESISVVDILEPEAPGAGEVLIQMHYAPINPADLLLIMGYYAVRPDLPSVIGNEGVGTVLKVGSGVETVSVGDRVAPPLSSFTYRERLVVPAAGLVALPVNADLQQLAMVGVNPVTAMLLLTEFKTLNTGDWIVQNAANSGVGRSVIAIAKQRGLRTVNIVRRPELVPELEAIGADAVVVDGPDLAQKIQAAIGTTEIGFALDGVSGTATAMLASSLSYGGMLVCYGAMSSQAITLGPGDVIYKSLVLRSFFLGHAHHAPKFPEAIRESARLIADGRLKVPLVGVYPIAHAKEAFERATAGGKVLLNFTV